MVLLQLLRAMFEHDSVPPQVPQETFVCASLFDHPDVDFVGLQIWQMFPGLVAPLPTKLPLIQHPVWQLPPSQIWPLPQLVPLPSFDQEVDEDKGWQVRHKLAELTVPLA